MFVRELTGGIYFGEKTATAERGHRSVHATPVAEIERVVRVAARLARTRRRQAHLDRQGERAGDLAPVARGGRRASCAASSPTCTLEHMLVDSAAMHLIRRPRDFDVVVTENMFGDILTDEAAMLAGSLGLLPSASLGDGTRGLYEPIHGSAPDIAGQRHRQSLGTILSAALLLRHSLGLQAEAAAVEQAVHQALEAGARTADIAAAGGAGRVLGRGRRGRAQQPDAARLRLGRAISPRHRAPAPRARSWRRSSSASMPTTGAADHR